MVDDIFDIFYFYVFEEIFVVLLVDERYGDIDVGDGDIKLCIVIVIFNFMWFWGRMVFSSGNSCSVRGVFVDGWFDLFWMFGDEYIVEWDDVIILFGYDGRFEDDSYFSGLGEVVFDFFC